ncbi:hypothetical protein SDC9_04003 [bioreactor metagenome]|uniref:Inner membrane protein alx n=1 Tax=bioreactor metagenome TaxID=1076179 RepID=A0A644SUU4_9ZZZZ|nr:TerC family protein [Negativicutes bacterium]
MLELIIEIAGSYTKFFELTTFWATISSPANWVLVGTLVMLEGLLSADNALVLAVMVKHLPPSQQRKALFYGIIGAYFFRFLAIGIGTFLIKIWWIKIIGALYLLWIVVQHFTPHGHAQGAPNRQKKMGFWRTVLAVEIMDIAFSIDSVLAAFGVSEQVWVLYLGGIFGVMMMRGVAQVFLGLIERYPELETTAYLLIVIIGLKMMGAAFNYHISQMVFFGILLIVFVGTFVVHHLQERRY